MTFCHLIGNGFYGKTEEQRRESMTRKTDKDQKQFKNMYRNQYKKEKFKIIQIKTKDKSMLYVKIFICLAKNTLIFSQQNKIIIIINQMERR